MNFSEKTAPPPPRDPGRLARDRYDVIVVGGGINGAGIARDLALRGLKILLLEKRDFASGTSSASTKLVHGGLRYLERLDLRLVFESCRERRILQRIAPHLVRPLPFLIPVYRDDARSLWTIRAGLGLYDTLALFRNTGRHRILSPDTAAENEPALRREGLSGAALYWDCRMDDARLCLANVVAAWEAGAETANYMEVVGFLRHGGRLCGVRVRDLEGKAELELEGEVVVNASGPWLDALCALDGEREKKLRPTRGTHILVPRLCREERALYLTAGRDDRLFFVLPWGELSLIGTTDTDDPGSPDEVLPRDEDIDYLLGEAARHLRPVSLSRRDVVASFAGLRPLVAAADLRTSRVSREHRIFDSPSGLLSVAGGKYTTYRAVASEVAALVVRRLGRGTGESPTARRPLPGGEMDDYPSFAKRESRRLAQEYGLDETTVSELVGRYGTRAKDVLALGKERPSLLGAAAPGSPLLLAEVRYAALHEMARTPEDVLRRRTSLALGYGRGIAEAPAVADVLGDALGTPTERRARTLTEYLQRYSHA